ncbi:hypothetical protein GOP47_0015219, partial [Adiantum capillus-veneris]
YSSEEEDDGNDGIEVEDSNNSDVDVSSLFLEEEYDEKQIFIFLMDNEDIFGPYEKLKESRVQTNVKQELIQSMLPPYLTGHENEHIYGPYERIEELTQPKAQPNVKQELIQITHSLDLASHEKGEYLHMMQQFPNLFITSYEKLED